MHYTHARVRFIWLMAQVHGGLLNLMNCLNGSENSRFIGTRFGKGLLALLFLLENLLERTPMGPLGAPRMVQAPDRLVRKICSLSR
jgi:hypothetical protein